MVNIVRGIVDTMCEVETHLIQRHYDGFLRKGRIRGGFRAASAYSRGEAAAQRTLMWLYVGIAVLVIAGVAFFLYGRSEPVKKFNHASLLPIFSSPGVKRRL